MYRSFLCNTRAEMKCTEGPLLKTYYDNENNDDLYLVIDYIRTNGTYIP